MATNDLHPLACDCTDCDAEAVKPCAVCPLDEGVVCIDCGEVKEFSPCFECLKATDSLSHQPEAQR